MIDTAAFKLASVLRAPGRPSHARCTHRGKSRAVCAAGGTDAIGRLALDVLSQRQSHMLHTISNVLPPPQPPNLLPILLLS